MKKKRELGYKLLCVVWLLCASGCQTTNSMQAPKMVHLPSLEREGSQSCYVIEDLLPKPNLLKKEQTSQFSLRYYTYTNAQYKDWKSVGVVLAFYSVDNHCWSLFDEYVQQNRGNGISLVR